VPCYIEKSAKLERAVTDLILSKTFDNGMICASEQAVIVDKEIKDEFENLMKKYKCVFLNEEEIAKLQKSIICTEKGCSINADIVGQKAHTIAKRAGINVPEDTKILVVGQEGIGEEFPLSKEKLSPVLAYYVAENTEDGISKAEKLISFGGLRTFCSYSF